MFIVVTPRVLAIEPGPFAYGATPRGFCTSVVDAFPHLGGRFDSTTPEERLHRCRWVVRWQDITELSAIEPWPSLRVAWKAGMGGDTRTLTPRRRWFGHEPTDEEKQWEKVFDALFDWMKATGRRVPGDPGWTRLEHVPWTYVSEWPKRHVGEGGYRTTSQELIVADRSKPTSFEFMLAWLAAGPRQPWSYTAREVAITKHFLYAQLAGRSMPGRLPLGSLRDSAETPQGTLYWFGRRTPFFLPTRADCPVRAYLNEIVATASQS